MGSFLLFLVAGILEIGGGYLVWIWLRSGRSPLLGIAGFLALALYGVVPVFQPRQNPFGRVYAAYGAIFIVLSMGWGWAVDGKTPDRWDWAGAVLCLVGAALMAAPRASAG
jgi:small multidrug resistance family-3 protein